MLLQKLKDAKRNYCTVVHALQRNFHDEATPLMTPKVEHWITLFTQFYEDCKVNPHEVEYLEADGTGVKVCNDSCTAQ